MNSKYGLCVLFFLSTTSFIFGQNLNLKSSCNEFEWKCKNGECISNDELCDGRKDCKDGSDETIDECLRFKCPSYAFRCAYGACVNGNAECNKIQDCADNSDERSSACRTQPVTTNNKCGEEEFQCKSGQCIAGDNECDGKADCSDKSDETVDLCFSKYCPSYSFTCAYGACVNGKAKCDGNQDCVDNSDEIPSLCEQENTTKPTPYISTKQPPRTRPTVRTTIPTKRPPTQSSTTGNCFVKSIKNLIYVYESDPTDEIEPETFVENYIKVRHKCQKKFNLIGPTSNTCVNGKWSSLEQPLCLKFCDKNKIKGITFQAACQYEGAMVSCNEPIRPKTFAFISCRIGYQKQGNDFVTNTLFCGNDGEWDFTPKSCQPICGKTASNITPFIAGGTHTSIKKVPWHAGIYHVSSYDGTIEHICGGSIINAKLIVTAAHCVWDDTIAEKVDHTTFRVAVGKYYRNYFATESDPAQYFNVSEIKVENGYLGFQASFQYDIALLVLNNFIIYTPYIAPICIEFEKFANKVIKSGEVGITAGWGLDDRGEFSDELKSLSLRSLSYEDCRSGFDQNRLALISGDKFCVRISNGRGICSGDSGGGYAIFKNDRYVLWGVVSTGFAKEGTDNICTSSNISVYTNVQYHSDLITNLEPLYRPN